MTKQLFMYGIVALGLLGCSSSPQAEDKPASQTGPVSADPVSSGRMDMADNELPPVTTRQAPPPSEAPKATVDQLKVALDSGNSREVEQTASKLLAINPKDTKALNALAVVQLRAGKSGMVRFISKRVLEIDPRNATAMNNMGVSYLMENDESRALTEFKKAHEADRTHVAAATNLAAIHAKYRNFSEARKVMENIYSKGRSSTILANNYALSLKGSGDFKAARRVYESAIEKDSRSQSLLLNYAILMVENIGDKTKGQDAINRLKLLATDPAIMEHARQLEAKLK